MSVITEQRNDGVKMAVAPTRLYGCLPVRFREPLWYARRLAWSRVVGNLTQHRHTLAEWRVKRGRYIAEVACADGMRLVVDLRDIGVGRPLFINRSYEPVETRFLESVVPRDGVFLDVGANIGFFSLVASRLVGPHGLVISIEPEAWNSELLRRNIKLNGLENVHVVQMAAGAAEGTATIHTSAENFGDHRLTPGGSDRHSTAIKLSTVDNILAAIGEGLQVDVMKMDVQGYEHEVFKGMRATLSKVPPKIILIEYWPAGIEAAGGDAELMLQELGALGYRAELLTQDGSTRVATVEDIRAGIPAFREDAPDASYINVVLRRQ